MIKGERGRHKISFLVSSFHDHIGDSTEMVVMWTTFTSANTSMVQYGEHGGNMTSNGTAKVVKFVDGGKNHTVRYMYTVTLTDLKPATKYGRYY